MPEQSTENENTDPFKPYKGRFKSYASIPQNGRDKEEIFNDPIVTEITKAEKFYSAEGYHQDFFTNNQSYPYCRAIIWPKLKKLGLLKED